MKNLLVLFALLFLFCSGLLQAQETSVGPDQKRAIDSFSLVLKNARHDTTRALVYNALCDVLYFSNPDTVVPLSRKAEALAKKNLSAATLNEKEKHAFNRILASVYNNLGFIYERKNKLEDARTHYEKSLRLEEKLGNESGAAMSRNNIALFYLNQGNIKKSTSLFFENLERSNKIQDKKALCYTLINLGYLYSSQGDTVNALKYYHQGQELSKSIGFKSSYATCASNIGIIYMERKQFDKALNLFETSHNIAHEMGDLESEAVALNNIGGVYQKTGKIKEALDCFEQAMKMLEQTGSEQYIIYTLGLQGGTYLEKGEPEKSLVYLKKSYALAIKLGYPETIKRMSALLHRAYKETGRYKESLEAYETFIRMRDSLDNAENSKIAAQKQLQYEYEKKEAEVKAAAKVEKEKTAAINREEKEKQQLIIYSVIAGLVLVLVFAVFMFNRFRVTQKQKKLIEIKEQETQLQKHLVEEKNREIFDSIDYAERLQRSLMANQTTLEQLLPQHFIYFNPKEAVSGDFYWAGVLKNGHFAIAVADSTGHGVPGAIMSMMNMNSLKESVKDGLCEADAILNETRRIIIETLANDGSVEGGKDGMDVALLVLNQEKTQLDFALANNPLWLVRNNEVIEYRADKMPVGKHDKQEIPFTKYSIPLLKGDLVYAFTDGYADQFGGEKGKKFKYSELKDLLLAISGKTMAEQKEILHNRFEDWKGNLEQIDDVCVMGIRV